MTVDWETVPLEQLVAPGRSISYGIVQPGASVNDGVPIVRVNDVRNGRIATASPMRVSPTIEAAYSRTRLQGGELLLTLVGTVGETAVVPTKLRGWNTARAVGVVPVSSEIGAYWVQLALRSPMVRHLIDSRLNTTVQATLNLGDVAKLPIVLPPLRERERITHILGTLDDKIDLNQQMNETLEAMARALFKSWFVDFDPIRAKAEQRDPGLPKPLADLFPDSFEDSGLRELPTSWEIGTLADFSSLNPEAWSTNTRPDVIHYVDLSNTKWGRIESVTAYQKQDAPSRAQRILRVQDTIVGTVRPGNGSYAYIADDGLTGSTGFAVLRPLRTEYAEFVYFAATSPESIETLSHLADGAAYPAVRPDVVAATQVVKPSRDVVELYSSITAPLLSRMTANERESRTLAVLRNSLLPKLVTGELRVRDVERAWSGG